MHNVSIQWLLKTWAQQERPYLSTLLSYNKELFTL